MGLTIDRTGIVHAADDGTVRRLTWRRLRTACFVLTILIFLISLPEMAAGQGRGLATVLWHHLYVLGWLLLVTFWTRTTSVRDVIAFWFVGMFPVVFFVYLLTAPLEAWLGDHPFHIAFFVPAVEEAVRLVPLVLWGLLLGRRQQVTASVSDLVVLGFALGGGFAFHEDSLWRRVGGTGFSDSAWGVLFPTFHDYDWNERIVTGHGGWGLLLGVGVGFYLVYRHRRLSWLMLLAPLAFTFLDHGRANAWGAGGELVNRLMANGQLPATLVLAAVVGAIAHDLHVQRWASRRDRLFPAVTLHHHLATARDPQLTTLARLRRLRAEIRYRRYRLAAFIDLYRARRRSSPAGDRTAVVEGLTTLATGAGLWSPDTGWRPAPAPVATRDDTEDPPPPPSAPPPPSSLPPPPAPPAAPLPTG